MATQEPRRTFDEVAYLYDRARPGYPHELFDDLVHLTGLTPGGRILEIGCGTGKATIPLAERGYQVTAVELGPHLATVAKRNLARFSNVDVAIAAFEDWPLPAKPFDVVMAAMSLRWIDPGVGYSKSAAALRPGGALAVFGTRHVAGGSEEFFEAVQECYEDYMPGTRHGLKLSRPEDVEDDSAEINASGLFEPPVLRRYLWQRVYATQAYLDVLNTYSDHRLLAPGQRKQLLHCVADLLESRFGGRIRKQYLTRLLVARKRSPQ